MRELKLLPAAASIPHPSITHLPRNDQAVFHRKEEIGANRVSDTLILCGYDDLVCVHLEFRLCYVFLPGDDVALPSAEKNCTRIGPPGAISLGRVLVEDGADTLRVVRLHRLP